MKVQDFVGFWVIGQTVNGQVTPGCRFLRTDLLADLDREAFVSSLRQFAVSTGQCKVKDLAVQRQLDHSKRFPDKINLAGFLQDFYQIFELGLVNFDIEILRGISKQRITYRS